MFKIIASRATGKTYNLFWQAIEFHRTNPEAKIIFVCPTFSDITLKQKWLDETGYDEASSDFIEFVSCDKLSSCLDKKAYIFIDELDACLKRLGVLGYSVSVEE